MSNVNAEILVRSLEKKNEILDQLIDINKEQEKLLTAETFDIDTISANLDKVDGLVEELNKLDRGFEVTYDRIRDEIMANKSLYKEEIKQMQNLIKQITDKIVKVNTSNERNNSLADTRFKTEKKAVSQSVSNTKVVQNYYNSMNNLNAMPPQFYDSKK